MPQLIQRSIRGLLACTLLVANAAVAQTPSEEPQDLIGVPLVGAPAEPRDPVIGNDGTQTRDETPARPDRIGGTAVVGDPTPANDHGDIYFTSPAPYGSAGILMQSRTTWPDITARLGANGSGSSFSVFNASDQILFKVTGSGVAGIGTSGPSAMLDIERNQDSGTVIEVNNANAGSGGANAWTGVKFMEGAVSKASISSVGSGSSTAAGGSGSLQVWNHATAPLVFATANTERMRIDSAGNVGIGYVAPAQRLTVLSQTLGVGAFTAQNSRTFTADTTHYDTAAYGLSYHTVGAGARNDGQTTGQAGGVILRGGGRLGSAVAVRADVTIESGQPATTTIDTAMGVFAKLTRNAGVIANGYGLYVGNVEATTDWGIYQAATDDDNYLAGMTTIGPPPPPPPPTGEPPPLPLLLDVRGNLNVHGSITGKAVIGSVYQDVAEWVPATIDMEPGTVVVLNLDRTNEVMPSHRPYDTGVAGVVSAQPGVLLGVAGDTKEKIATTGRVRVRVDATRTPIRVGDLLVTSDKPGVAMRSIPVDVAGISMHRPGTIVGKALEPLASGEGEILVLLSMQ